MMKRLLFLIWFLALVPTVLALGSASEYRFNVANTPCFFLTSNINATSSIKLDPVSVFSLENENFWIDARDFEQNDTQLSVTLFYAINFSNSTYNNVSMEYQASNRTWMTNFSQPQNNAMLVFVTCFDGMVTSRTPANGTDYVLWMERKEVSRGGSDMDPWEEQAGTPGLSKDFSTKSPDTVLNLNLKFKELVQHPKFRLFYDVPSELKSSYRTFEVKEMSFNNSDLDKATFEFFVNTSYLEKNKLVPEQVFLYRFNGKSWDRLQTDFLSINGTRAYYRAFSPFLSLFAISSDETDNLLVTGLPIVLVVILLFLATLIVHRIIKTRRKKRSKKIRKAIEEE